MAEDDIPDLDLDDSLDWLYVEDDFPLADELAETQIPDPGYAGTNHELSMQDFYDYDLYEFWDDLTYGDDCYWDSAGQKRKQGTAKTATNGAKKRRKLSLKDTSGDNVHLVDRATRNKWLYRQRPVTKDLEPFALLPDWRVRFADESAIIVGKKEMPDEMKMAAEAEDSDTPAKDRLSRGAFASEDVEEEEGDEDEEDLSAQLSSLDPEMLKSILRQKLGDAGLAGMNEDAFMQVIAKMLSAEDDGGGGREEDITATLADSLLNQATQGNDAAVSGWLSQQGVSLSAQEVDDEEDGDATADGDAMEGAQDGEVSSTLSSSITTKSAFPRNARLNVHSSPADSAVAGTGSKETISPPHVDHHAPVPANRSRKRPASRIEPDEFDAPKKLKGDTHLPASAHSAISTLPQNGKSPIRRAEGAAAAMAEKPPLARDSDGAQSKAAHVIESKATRSNRPISSLAPLDPPAASTHSEAKSGIPPPTSTAEMAPLTAEGEDVAPVAARQTRKRKAAMPVDDEDGAQGLSGKSKRAKQARKGSAPPAVPAGRATRSTRSVTHGGPR